MGKAFKMLARNWRENVNGIGLVCRMEDDTSHAIELSGYVILVTKTKAGKMQLLGKSLSVTIVFYWCLAMIMISFFDKRMMFITYLPYMTGVLDDRNE